MDNTAQLEKEILFNFLVQDLVATDDMNKQEAEAFVKKQLKGAMENED